MALNNMPCVLLGPQALKCESHCQQKGVGGQDLRAATLHC